MAKVYNWHLGREMEYPHEGVRPVKQFGMILDTNKCIACQTCTVACKTTWTPGRGQETMFWNNVESKPYGYYPLGWDVKILDKLGVQDAGGAVYQGKTLFDAAPDGERILGYLPEDADYAHPNIGEDDSTGLMSQGIHLTMPHMQWMYYLPRICNHCTYPACLAACSRNSIYKRPEDGIVLIDQTRCRGYRECVKGCPYKKPFFNSNTRTSEKCVGCYPAIESGRQTQCTITCIGKIRLQGFISAPDQVREDNPLDYIVHIAKLGRPLYPQFGLEPNTYYIPPVHVPPAYLYQMFGTGVEQAIAGYRKAKDDPKLLGALLLFGACKEIIHHYKVDGSSAMGFNEQGEELVRVPLVEPIHVRAAHDEKFQAYRTNIT
ncbi:MAG: dehydrogenase [Magnetococcales bacterium]|nr:dehydrogenase [Magnetococcales bacterium]MBF0148496.1 dehydrogenase [Magnetococcales bacterium]MBF0173942.1 dehydrogenase [Magnetococcales bacterium]MBF0632568.1 dehydrogenase [Magnetococcales bacterium]